MNIHEQPDAINSHDDPAVTTTIIDVLTGGRWPADACLRWNTREDMTVETGLRPNEYAHEIANVKNDGAFGWDFDSPMSPDDVRAALDFIAENVIE